MIFEMKAKALKQVWKNETSFLYNVEELNEKRKKWNVWTKEPLELNQEYELKGTVTESKDKKVKDANGYDIWRTQLNVEIVKQTTADIPF